MSAHPSQQMPPVQSPCHLVAAGPANAFGPEYASVYDALTSRLDYQSWVDYVEDLANLRRCTVHTILDLACGTGSFAIAALNRGYKVIGIDLSQCMLKQFRLKLTRSPARHRCRIYQSSLTDLWLREPVDAAVCFFDSVNYLLGPDPVRLFFSTLRVSLKPGALFLFDLNTDAAYRRNVFSQSGVLYSPSLSELRYEWKGEYCPAHGIYALDMVFLDTSSQRLRFRERHLQRFYPQDCVAFWLEAAGFTDIQCLRAFSLEPAGLNDERWTFVCRVPDRPN